MEIFQPVETSRFFSGFYEALWTILQINEQFLRQCGWVTRFLQLIGLAKKNR